MEPGLSGGRELRGPSAKTCLPQAPLCAAPMGTPLVASVGPLHVPALMGVAGPASPWLTSSMALVPGWLLGVPAQAADPSSHGECARGTD